MLCLPCLLFCLPVALLAVVGFHTVGGCLAAPADPSLLRTSAGEVPVL